MLFYWLVDTSHEHVQTIEKMEKSRERPRSRMQPASEPRYRGYVIRIIGTRPVDIRKIVSKLHAEAVLENDELTGRQASRTRASPTTEPEEATEPMAEPGQDPDVEGGL